MKQFNAPFSLALDNKGNIYVSDNRPGAIKKINFDGVVITLQRHPSYLSGIAITDTGIIYFSDNWNHRICKLDTNTNTAGVLAGNVKGFADGKSTDAQFNFPEGIALDSNNNLYVADSSNHAIRKITPDGYVTTIAGVGTPGYLDDVATYSQFNKPWNVAVDKNNYVYVADRDNHCIRKIANNFVSTYAGGTASNEPQFRYPCGVTVDKNNYIYVADTGNNSIKKINANGTVTTLAGLSSFRGYLDGAGKIARFYEPYDLVVDAENNLYVVDTSNACIRHVTSAGFVTTLA